MPHNGQKKRAIEAGHKSRQEYLEKLTKQKEDSAAACAPTPTSELTVENMVHTNASTLTSNSSNNVIITAQPSSAIAMGLEAEWVFVEES